jgi:hypothetical protein
MFRDQTISGMVLKLTAVIGLAEEPNRQDSANIEKIDSSRAIDYRFRTNIVAVQMRKYVGQNMTKRFRALIFELDSIDGTIRQNHLGHSSSPHRSFDDQRKSNLAALDHLEDEFGKFDLAFDSAMTVGGEVHSQ